MQSEAAMPLTTHPENTSLTPSERMVNIIRMVRRICVLREDGEMLDARRVEEGELLPAVEAFRKARGEEALPEPALQEIFAIETRRVADAGVLCELLVPRLAARLPTFAVAGAINAAPVTRVPSAAVPAPGGPPAIPDLLDAMLAADRASAREKAPERSKF
jgi:hypothetical protein